jgi:hypothetical protein
VTSRRTNAAVAGRSGRDIAAQYVASLRAECERAWDENEPLPRLPTGEVNKSEVAIRCGFPRRVFATNPSALEVLQEWDTRDRARHTTELAIAQKARERMSRTEEYAHKLERRVLELEAEVASLRRDCARYAAIEELMTQTGKLP